MRRILKSLALAMALCILSSCTIENTQSYTISPETEYVLVQSDLLSSQQGRISSFDKNGKEIQHANIIFQDGGYIAVDKNRDFYVAGERGNDNVIFTRGKAQFFHQLDERDRSGATAIYLDQTVAYASMNGTFSQEDGYYTVLVARDRKSNKTLYQTRIPLYACSILEYQNDIYTLGDNQSANTNNAVATILDKKTGKIKKTHHFKEYTGITDAYTYNDMLFVVVQRNYDPFEYEIMRWNEGNLVPLDETYISHADGGIKINAADDIIYGMEESRIFAMTLDGRIVKTLNNAKKDFENTYMEMIGNTLYVVSRKNKDKTSYEVIQKFDHKLNKIEHDITLEVPWIGQHMLAIKPNTGNK